jgi:hypothetical protein
MGPTFPRFIHLRNGPTDMKHPLGPTYSSTIYEMGPI